MANSHAHPDWEHQLRSCCKQGMLITKKQLEEITGLSDTTITKSIQACLLDTTKPSYTPQEIEEVFIVARKMLEGSTGDGRRYSYRDVEQHFRMRSAGVDESKRPSRAAGYTEYVPNQVLHDLAKGVSDGIAGTLQPVIDAALQQYIQGLPMLIVSQMNAQIAKGTVRRVTQEAGRLLVSEQNFLFESGTDDNGFEEEFIEADTDDIEGDHTDNGSEEEEGI